MSADVELITRDDAGHADALVLARLAALDTAVDAYWRLEEVTFGTDNEAGRERAWATCLDLARSVCTLPVQSLPGLRAKARALALLPGVGPGEPASSLEIELAATIARDLVRVLARPDGV